jgi:hypothetical protein
MNCHPTIIDENEKRMMDEENDGLLSYMTKKRQLSCL